MSRAVTPGEFQNAMAVYASDDETRLHAGGDETEIVALTDGGIHRVEELRPERQSPNEDSEEEPPAFPI